jgi:hypothetical protein
MREKCARVLAAALMTGAIAFTLAIPAFLATARDGVRSPTAPPSSLQRSVHLVASAPSRPVHAGRLEDRRSIVRALPAAVAPASGQASSPERKPRPAPRPAPRPSPPPAPATETRTLANDTSAASVPEPAAAVSQPPNLAGKSKGKGKAKGSGKEKQTGKPTDLVQQAAPAATTTPPPPPPDQSPQPEDEKDHGNGKAKGHDKGRDG